MRPQDTHCRGHFPCRLWRAVGIFAAAMANYSHDRIVPFKDSELGKKQQIAEMFDKIAFRYDFLNRFLSGGIDVYWRKRAIRALRGLLAGAAVQLPAVGAGAEAGAVLDVATGT